MQVLIDLQKIRDNREAIQKLCAAAGVTPVWITKGCHSHPEVLGALGVSEGVIGSARLQDCTHIRKHTSAEVMMTRFPPASEVAASMQVADTIAISHRAHVDSLCQEAAKQDLLQNVLILVDLGNGREGALPDDVPELVRETLAADSLNLVGIGTALGCFGGFRVHREDMCRLGRVSHDVRKCTGWQAPCLSVGSGTMLLDLLQSDDLPAEITHLRIGAALLVGDKPPTKKPFAFLHQDAWLLRGEILELYEKPPIAVDRLGTDAFGKQLLRHTEPRVQALLDFGVVDTDIDCLTPLCPTCRIVGASTDYTVCDVTECPDDLAIGNTLDFRMGYSAMVRAMVSPHTAKQFLN